MAKYALVIGIAQYESPLRLLPKAAADAEAIATLLESHGYNVTRLPKKQTSPGQWTIDTAQKLTHETFIAELKTFLRDRAANQAAIIYFAGHGFRVTNSMTDEAEGYLAVSNSATNGRNAIAISNLNTLIGKSNLSSLVMLFDCCYAGTIIEQQSLLKSTETTVLQKSNYCLIAACRDFEVSREGAEHGLFTDAVLRGLSRDRAEDGVITSSSLLGFVEKELTTSGQEAIHAGRGQSIPIISYRSPTIAPTIDETCPYQGLKPFDRDTAKFFFGRDRIVRQLLEKLEQSSFVPVIGASGSGKSSIVRAGLIPELEKSGWHILNIIQPGVEPIAKLKAILEQFFRDQGQLSVFTSLHSRMKTEGLRPFVEHFPGYSKVLLVIDQFEEVFTICASEQERSRFIECLTQMAEPPSRLSIVTTMRADFLEPCLSYRSLAQLIQDWKILALPMDEQELESVIVEPAKRQGYQLSEGLLDLILEDVRQEKNCLPLLQFALTELWEHRDQRNHTLTLAYYRQMGKVLGALDLYANQMYERLDESEKEWVKRICLKLARTGRDEKDTRQRQPKQLLLELASSEQEQAIVGKALNNLIDRRLLVVEQENEEIWVDLAHEALMNGWKYFVQWRQENREMRRLAYRIEDAYREWLQKNQNDDYLIQGGLLQEIQENWSLAQPNLSISSKQFYTRSKLHLEQKNNELLLQQIQEVEQLKGQFLSNTTQLRTPLNGMLGFLKLILDGMADDPEEQREFIEEAHNSALHLGAIIEDVLDIAKIEAGKMQIDLSHVKLDEVLLDIDKFARTQTSQKNLSFEIQKPSTYDEIILYANYQRLKQVMLNLVNNAIKFTHEGGITVNAEVIKKQIIVQNKTLPGMLKVRIADTGIGVSLEKQDKLFQSFSQVDGSITRQYGGTGLGLAISQRLVEAMGGVMHFDSIGEGLGSTVTFTVPLYQEPVLITG